jgi:hypothetical protein
MAHDRKRGNAIASGLGARRLGAYASGARATSSQSALGRLRRSDGSVVAVESQRRAWVGVLDGVMAVGRGDHEERSGASGTVLAGVRGG